MISSCFELDHVSLSCGCSFRTYQNKILYFFPCQNKIWFVPQRKNLCVVVFPCKTKYFCFAKHNIIFDFLSTCKKVSLFACGIRQIFSLCFRSAGNEILLAETNHNNPFCLGKQVQIFVHLKNQTNDYIYLGKQNHALFCLG